MKFIKKLSKRGKEMMKKNSSSSVQFGKMNLDENMKYGLIGLVVILVIALLIKNILGSIIENLLIFSILFIVILLVSKNYVISILLSIVFYVLIYFIRGYTNKIEKYNNIEKFENSGIEDSVESNESNMNNETFDNDDSNDLENNETFESEISGYDSMSNNIDESEISGVDKFTNYNPAPFADDNNGNPDEGKVTKKEVDDLNEEHGSAPGAVIGGLDTTSSQEQIDEFVNLFDGGVQMKNEDKKDSNPLGVNTKKYTIDKKSGNRKIQEETYQLINGLNQLQNSIKGLSPLLTEANKVMTMFDGVDFNKGIKK